MKPKTTCPDCGASLAPIDVRSGSAYRLGYSASPQARQKWWKGLFVRSNDGTIHAFKFHHPDIGTRSTRPSTVIHEKSSRPVPDSAFCRAIFMGAQPSGPAGARTTLPPHSPSSRHSMSGQCSSSRS
jgi:hypothetical protein